MRGPPAIRRRRIPLPRCFDSILVRPFYCWSVGMTFFTLAAHCTEEYLSRDRSRSEQILEVKYGRSSSARHIKNLMGTISQIY